MNGNGTAYNPNEILVTGYTDVLTSQQIDLSEAQVATSERSSVYLSFFYQWQGKGEAPDRDDYLEVEFLDADSVWVVAAQIYPLASYDRS